MWRPNNWLEFLDKALEKDPDVDGYYSNEHLMEAGADAILKALKENGIRASNIKDIKYPRSDVLTIPTIEEVKNQYEVDGFWVFIPNEGDQDAKSE